MRKIREITKAEIICSFDKLLAAYYGNSTKCSYRVHKLSYTALRGVYDKMLLWSSDTLQERIMTFESLMSWEFEVNEGRARQ